MIPMPHTNEVDKLNATFSNAGDMKEGRIMEILRQAKTLAQEYRTLTGKPLGITG